MQPLPSVVSRVRYRGTTPSSPPANSRVARPLRAALLTLDAAAASSSAETSMLWSAFALGLPLVLGYLDAICTALSTGTSHWNR
jgi:hypothetical protein